MILILKIGHCILEKLNSISLILITLIRQLCSGVDDNAVGTCSELIFAPIDASFSDDAPLLPSGFRIIPLDSGVVSIYFVLYNLHICVY